MDSLQWKTLFFNGCFGGKTHHLRKPPNGGVDSPSSIEIMGLYGLKISPPFPKASANSSPEAPSLGRLRGIFRGFWRKQRGVNNMDLLEVMI